MSVANKEKVDFNENKIRHAALAVRAINHKLRQRILYVIDEGIDGELTVTDIYIKLRIEQSVASQHLAILRRAGVIKAFRQGKFIFYSINHDVLSDLKSAAEQMSSHRDDRVWGY